MPKPAPTPAPTSRARASSKRRRRHLFLDEIGTLPLAGQVKLLRVPKPALERLGGNRERSVKVRIVSATNANLPRR